MHNLALNWDKAHVDKMSLPDDVLGLHFHYFYLPSLALSENFTAVDLFFTPEHGERCLMA